MYRLSELWLFGMFLKDHPVFFSGHVRRSFIFFCLVGILFVNGCRSSAPDDKTDPRRLETPRSEEMGPTARPGSPRLWADGLVEVVPDGPVGVGSYHTWRVSFSLKSERLESGASLLFIVSPFWGWSPPQTSDPLVPGYTTVQASVPSISVTLSTPARHMVRCDIIAGSLCPDERLTFVYGDTRGGVNESARARTDNFVEHAPAFYFRISRRDDDFRLLCIGPAQTTIASEQGHTVRAYAPSDVVSGKSFQIRIAHVDGAENRSSVVFEDLRIIDRDDSISIPVSISSFHDGTGSIAMTLNRTGWHHLLLINKEKSIRFEINPLYCHPTAPAERIFWGDIHGHSSLSDGSGTPSDYFAYARDVAGLDFSALTDHDDHGFLPLTGQSWLTVREAVSAFHGPGRFITFLAYEWTSWTCGHRNVYFPGDEGMVFPFSDSDSDTLPKLWRLLGPYAAMTVPHHPAGGPIAADWRFHDPMKEPLVEIVSVHGSSESPRSPSLIYQYKPGASVFDALNRGYRLGTIGSSDSHDGHPGAYPRLGEMRGLVAIRAPELKREVLWNKLMTRNCYATSGVRIYLDFFVNDQPMGSELTCPADRPRKIVAHAVGTGYIENMVLVRNGEIIHRVGGVDYQAAMSWTDSRKETTDKETDWYVVRVLQLDGQMAWSSPVWVSIE